MERKIGAPLSGPTMGSKAPTAKRTIAAKWWRFLKMVNKDITLRGYPYLCFTFAGHFES